MSIGLSPLMAYRRSNETDPFSSRWRIKHRADLADCGIPPDIANDDRRWRYVVLHGDDLVSGWSETWLSDEQATKLLALLEPHFPAPSGIWLVEALQRRLRSGNR